jgi:ParB-like chromosome segregation protein Spo0J
MPLLATQRLLVQVAELQRDEERGVRKISKDDEAKERQMEDHLDWIKDHPVSNVQWVDASKVCANDYNPNSVAPPEMRLLELSIKNDGYTQPIVTWLREDGMYEVVDGFHRHRVGNEVLKLSHLPVVVINANRQDKTDRMASTIRHNRARGKHAVTAMSDIVQELTRRNWSDAKIAKELGMDADEVLRLKQVSGLAAMFADAEFSEAWEIEK